MIKIENLTKKIDKKIIFDNLNLDIPSKKITFIIGKSGIGKTTLINLIAGFTNKDSGKISFLDENGTEIKKPLVDIVFQDFNLITNISSENNILIANNVINRVLDPKELGQQAKYVSIETQQLKQKVNNLSGGEKQRIAILRSLSRDSDFILLDEPTGNLDFENGVSVFENLKNIAKNKTILVVSHNLEFAKKYADKIVRIEKGKISEENIDKSEENLAINNEKSSQLVSFKSSSYSKIPKIKQELKTGLLLTLSDYKSKLVSTILFVILFLTSIFGTLLFGVLNLNIFASNSLKVNELQLDSVLISKKSERDVATFTDNDINNLREKNKSIKKIIPFFTFPSLGFEYNDKRKLGAHIDYIDESEFFKNRFNFDQKNLIGRNIENIDEIIISKEAATELDIKEPKGQEIAVLTGAKDKKTLKVVGINNLVNAKRLNLSFLHHKFGEDIELQSSKNREPDNPQTSQTKKIEPIILRLYFENDNLENNIDNFIENNKEYNVDSSLKGITKTTYNLQNFINLIVGAILIVFIVILLIQTIFYTKNLTDSKVKLIGILKALRAKTWQIFLYHWLNIIIISFLILVINLSVSLPLIPKIYMQILGEDAIYPSISQIVMLIFIIWIAMFFIISFIYLLISWINYRKPVTKLLKFDQF
ncbi:ATP-binding cassette domain-containing protein [Mesomycoplasma ovipneumoniae]|uniref:ATP-binding cassette domain-containing protein n=2 Tax=Mesomycoplasma ovipneumoniae TaxID=29562 RepID=A0AAP5Y306_9BACT|nr:ATP-binding cassette domain-containing protein [Mesomycoplasma ovipneumoniae]MDW2907111.1 ATP-binding cassette domain-containing protein [Mesomycoplasma ovipneumoniae]MDW2907742.1 ATP-binding cassette domain-containing protein [Mesomycoplasma ovipneumoniae]MDW2911376.1 ATP-binding cassette domain-containing protein [Mesomycoplasma ovipneumoniae]MDW2916621.1 ATP-binding cassette domain-containing protein [Mesomycoplasma ovipneumoniae]MDW2917094.1 ATP-binding cassette domain-containing protei